MGLEIWMHKQREEHDFKDILFFMWKIDKTEKDGYSLVKARLYHIILNQTTE